MDVESPRVLLPSGEIVDCDRRQESSLFRRVIGGYGLFGIVLSVRLRLVPRVKVRRVVTLESIERLMERFDERIAGGCLYGDFQFAAACEQRGFLHDGVFSCYQPIDPATPIPARQIRLSKTDWEQLTVLVHRDKHAAFERFADFYLRSSGQIYFSDTHQLNIYLDDYHGHVDRCLGSPVPGTEMITELYVPRPKLVAFMEGVREDLHAHPADVIYGTVRLIEKDQDAFLAWAREPWACVIFKLHVDHLPHAVARAAEAFRRLIDRAIAVGGSYFLTYHRFARRDQVLACYPRFVEFLRAKVACDPAEVLASDWYLHHRRMFADAL